MLEKYASITISVGIFLQAYCVRLHTGTWLTPASLYGLFWSVFTTIPLLVVPNGYTNPIAILYILSSCILFSLPTFLFRRHLWMRDRLLGSEEANLSSAFLRICFFALGITALVATPINWQLQGFSLYSVAFNLLETSNQFLVKRYEENLDTNIFGQISIVFSYPTAVLGGILYAGRAPVDRGLRYLSISLSPPLLAMLVEAAKGTVFLSIALFWSGTLIWKLHNKDRSLFSRGSIIKLAPWMGLVILSTVFAFIARGMDTDDPFSIILRSLYFSIVSYSAGHLYAFSDWFSYTIGDYSVLSYRSLVDSNGFYTFMAVFNALGTSKVVPHGVYDEYFFIDNVLQTNIYTHFRGLIVDFGMIGALLVSAAAGLFLSIVHIQFLNGRLKAIGASVFAHFIGYCYTSFIISLLIWNSVFASFALISIILFINSKYKFLRKIFFASSEKGIYRHD